MVARMVRRVGMVAFGGELRTERDAPLHYLARGCSTFDVRARRALIAASINFRKSVQSMQML